jgi:hypothetical protein
VPFLKERCAAKEEEAAQVDRLDAVPLGSSQLQRRLEGVDAGVVHEDVDGSMPLDGVADQLLQVRFRGHVGAKISFRGIFAIL